MSLCQHKRNLNRLNNSFYIPYIFFFNIHGTLQVNIKMKTVKDVLKHHINKTSCL